MYSADHQDVLSVSFAGPREVCMVFTIMLCRSFCWLCLRCLKQLSVHKRAVSQPSHVNLNRIASQIYSCYESHHYVGFTDVIRLNLMVPCTWQNPNWHQQSYARLLTHDNAHRQVLVETLMLRGADMPPAHRAEPPRHQRHHQSALQTAYSRSRRGSMHSCYTWLQGASQRHPAYLKVASAP